MSGSAPRVRGTPKAGCGAVPACRFSPACAGNTLVQKTAPVHRSVQPRVCGEHHLRCLGKIRKRGSAPRVRGTPVSGRGRVVQRRFSPACAGNTEEPSPGPPPPPVQPRVCGEHTETGAIAAKTGGSAPRVRGTPRQDAITARKIRFSPACAGNTRGTAGNVPSRSVQPRVCGEHLDDYHLSTSVHGSAPRVRGTHYARRYNEPG